MLHTRLTAAALLAACATAASADVLGHLSEDAIILPSPPADVTLGALEDNASVFVFHESDFTVSGGFAVDHAAVGLVDAGAELMTTPLVDGQRASSYHVHLDTVGNQLAIVDASITFSTEILGVLVRDSSLTNTNSSLGAPETLYAPGGGPELNPDNFEISADRRTLSFTGSVSVGVDRLRVIVDKPFVGLVHEYDFEGGGFDSVSNADILMGDEAQFSADGVPFALGQAFRISSEDSFNSGGEISTSEFLDLANTDFTIAFSIRRLEEGDTPEHYTVIDAVDNAGWRIVMPDDGGIRFDQGDEQGFAATPPLAFGIANDEWHHVAFTCDRSETDGARWYFDGVLVSAHDATLYGSLTPDRVDIFFGVSTGEGDNMGAMMGRMQVYNFSLDAEQVRSIAYDTGSVAEPVTCDADFDNDGVVNASDLAIILAAWGMCP